MLLSYFSSPVALRVRALSVATLASLAITACGGSSSSPDRTPEDFSFTAVTDVAIGTTAVSSDEVVIQDISSGTPVTVEGATLLIDGAAVSGEDIVITQGQTVQLQLDAAEEFSTERTATITIGNTTQTFSVTTEAEDLIPDSFSLNQKTEVAPDAVVQSDPITITGINAATTVSVTGGSYVIGTVSDTNPFTTESGTIENGQTITLQTTAPSASAGEAAEEDVVLTVGDQSATFTVVSYSDQTPPEVTIVFPPKVGLTAKDSMTVRVLIDDATGVDDESVTINGLPAVKGATEEEGYTVELTGLLDNLVGDNAEEATVDIVVGVTDTSPSTNNITEAQFAEADRAHTLTIRADYEQAFGENSERLQEIVQMIQTDTDEIILAPRRANSSTFSKVSLSTGEVLQTYDWLQGNLISFLMVATEGRLIAFGKRNDVRGLYEIDLANETLRTIVDTMDVPELAEIRNERQITVDTRDSSRVLLSSEIGLGLISISTTSGEVDIIRRVNEDRENRSNNYVPWGICSLEDVVYQSEALEKDFIHIYDRNAENPSFERTEVRDVTSKSYLSCDIMKDRIITGSGVLSKGGIFRAHDINNLIAEPEVFLDFESGKIAFVRVNTLKPLTGTTNLIAGADDGVAIADRFSRDWVILASYR